MDDGHPTSPKDPSESLVSTCVDDLTNGYMLNGYVEPAIFYLIFITHFIAITQKTHNIDGMTCTAWP